MTLKQMKNEIKRLKLIASIDFDEKHFEEAAERHEARLTCVIGDYWFGKLNEARDKPSPKKGEPVDEELRKNFVAGLKNLQKKIVIARVLLVDDTPKKWAEDQDFMEKYEYEKFGEFFILNRRLAFGRSPEEMWNHYLYLTTEPSRPNRERELELKKEREKLEKKHGKPIRLHPDYSANTWKCYKPVFKDESLGWGPSHLYPYADFPDFSGDSIVELED